VVAALLAAPAVAGAAYDPHVELTVPDAGPGAPAALSSVITQADGEESTRDIEARLPGTFGFNSLYVSSGCSAADEAANTCPDSARIGSIDATSPFGQAAGPMYITSDFRLLGTVKAFGLFEFKAQGILQVEKGQIIVVRFTGLPPIPVTRLALTMEGGARTPLALPRDCGEHVITTILTSQSGEVRESEHPVSVSGCGELPTVDAARVKRGRLRWRSSAPVTEVRVLHEVRRTWRSVGTRTVKGGRSLRVAPRWKGHRLQPGRYLIEVTAIDAAGTRSVAREVTFRVR
jgi:hypothetical protein